MQSAQLENGMQSPSIFNVHPSHQVSQSVGLGTHTQQFAGDGSQTVYSTQY